MRSFSRRGGEQARPLRELLVAETRVGKRAAILPVAGPARSTTTIVCETSNRRERPRPHHASRSHACRAPAAHAATHQLGPHHTPARSSLRRRRTGVVMASAVSVIAHNRACMKKAAAAYRRARDDTAARCRLRGLTACVLHAMAAQHIELPRFAMTRPKEATTSPLPRASATRLGGSCTRYARSQLS